MSELLAIEVESIERVRPLAPLVCLVEGEAARALARRLTTAPADELDPRLLGVSSRARVALVLSGPSDALPWIDGARYLGLDPDAPRLRLSCTHAPALRDGAPLSASLLERAILSKLARGAGRREAHGPYAVLRDRVIALGASRPLDRALLERFVRETEDAA